MCYNLAIEATRSRFQKEFGWDPGEGWKSAERLNGFDHPFTPLLVCEHEGPGWTLASWGLVPPWLSGEAVPKRTATLNARLETADSKPSFREAWQRGRAVVPATGFWEYRSLGKKKELALIKPKEGWLYLAALASWWNSPNGRVLTWTLLTTESSGWFREIHERMPVALNGEMKEKYLSNIKLEPAQLAVTAVNRPAEWVQLGKNQEKQNELFF